GTPPSSSPSTPPHRQRPRFYPPYEPFSAPSLGAIGAEEPWAAPRPAGPSETSRRGPAARTPARWAARGEERGGSRSEPDPRPAGRRAAHPASPGHNPPNTPPVTQV